MLLAILHFLTSVFAVYFHGTMMSLCLGVNFLCLVIELKINKKTINAIELQWELSAGGTAGIKLVREIMACLREGDLEANNLRYVELFHNPEP